MAASNPAFSIPEVSGQPGIQVLPHEVSFAYLSPTLANEMGIDHPPGEGVYVNPFDTWQTFFRGEDQDGSVEHDDLEKNMLLMQMGENPFGVRVKQSNLEAALAHREKHNSPSAARALGGFAICLSLSAVFVTDFLDGTAQESSAVSVAKSLVAAAMLIAPAGLHFWAVLHKRDRAQGLGT
jgi:hypothetical protein